MLLHATAAAAAAAAAVSAYVTHGVFPKESWNKFKADNGGEGGTGSQGQCVGRGRATGSVSAISIAHMHRGSVICWGKASRVWRICTLHFAVG
jgi:hypothetical protein